MMWMRSLASWIATGVATVGLAVGLVAHNGFAITSHTASVAPVTTTLGAPTPTTAPTFAPRSAPAVTSPSPVIAPTPTTAPALVATTTSSPTTTSPTTTIPVAPTPVVTYSGGDGSFNGGDFAVGGDN